MGPVVITSFQVQEAINAAAKVKDEEMYIEIEYLDLIVKGLKCMIIAEKHFLGDLVRSTDKARKLEDPR